MKEEKIKYLEKYVELEKKVNKKYHNDKIKFIDDDEDIANTDKYLHNTNTSNKIQWKELNDEEESNNEDEFKAIELARKEYIDEEKSELIGNKRERHDSESESESEIEKELNELINDEDGDLIITNNKISKKDGLVIEIKENKDKIKVLSSLGKELKKKTVYRDEFGRKVDKSETKEAKKKELEKLNYENLEKWSKGLIQKEEIKLKKEELIQAKKEPFARYDIDEQTEINLKIKERFGDPMKHLIFKNNFDQGMKKIENTSPDLSRGFYLPKCKFAGIPNRFGIVPGYRWDGVDRGTGYEIKYLESINIRKAREQEFHKLRTEEM